MNRKYKNQKHINSVPSHPTQSHVNLGGAGQPERKNRPARSFSLGFWKVIGAQANDNIARHAVSKLRTPCLVFGAFVLGTMMGMNASALATQAVLHADDAVLSTAMETNPQALGYVLNSMDIGE